MLSSNKPVVYCVGKNRLGLENIFFSQGWVVLFDEEADRNHNAIDYVAFAGGADISPVIYGQKAHKTTSCNHARDKFELDVYQRFKNARKLGICRGAQLLNVLNGGSLWQNVTGHENRPHKVTDSKGRQVTVSSVHHQMMRPGPEHQLLAWSVGLSKLREDDRTTERFSQADPEVIFYPKDQALCFQGHPEFGPEECTEYFFQQVKECFGIMQEDNLALAATRR